MEFLSHKHTESRYNIIHLIEVLFSASQWAFYTRDIAGVVYKKGQPVKCTQFFDLPGAAHKGLQT